MSSGVLGLLAAASIAALCTACSTPPPPPTAAPPASASVPPVASQRTARGHTDLIRVDVPAPDAQVASPLRVSGEARGAWYFEATFPIRLLDGSGRVLAESYAQARGEWMTEAYVPFAGELTFAEAAPGAGTLVLEKANASGLPEHADELRIPLQLAR